MPYGMPKDEGGDSKKNDKWMEGCVKKVMAQGKDKSTAVAICKSTFMKMHKNEKKSSIAINFYLNMTPEQQEARENELRTWN